MSICLFAAGFCSGAGLAQLASGHVALGVFNILLALINIVGWLVKK